MDELKLKLYTQPLKALVSTIIAKAIRKKTGHEVLIRINDVSIENDENGKLNFHIDVDGQLTQDELIKILKSM